jgi:CBS domain-containing protein
MPPFSVPVSAFMTSPVVTLPETARLADAVRLLRDHGVSCLAVTDAGGRAVGVVSRTDVLHLGRAAARGWGRVSLLALPDRALRDVIARGVVAVAPRAPLADAARLMLAHRIHRVFVVEEDAILGVLGTRDMLLAIERAGLDRPIGGVMSAPAFTVPASAALATATDGLERAHVWGLGVVDEEGWPVGTFTQTEALEARDLPGDTPLEDVMSNSMLCLHVRTALSRAAAHARATRARRVLAVEGSRVRGVLTGLDFARVVAAA